jgi:hypothetical protein
MAKSDLCVSQPHLNDEKPVLLRYLCLRNQEAPQIMIEASIIQKSTTRTIVALIATSSNMFDQISNSLNSRKSNVSRPEMKPKPSIFSQWTYANVESNRLIIIRTVQSQPKRKKEKASVILFF